MKLDRERRISWGQLTPEDHVRRDGSLDRSFRVSVVCPNNRVKEVHYALILWWITGALIGDRFTGEGTTARVVWGFERAVGGGAGLVGLARMAVGGCVASAGGLSAGA